MVVPTGSPLNYPTNARPPITRISRNFAPSSNNYKNFREGDEWLDKSADVWYKLADITGTTATWTAVSGAGISGINTITTPDTTVVTPVANNVNLVNGTGIAVTGSGDDITITATATPFIVIWTVIAAATKQIVVNEGYFANRGVGVEFNLPTTSSVGDVFYLSAIDAGGWSLTQNALQNIRIGNQITTTGAGGSLASSAIGDSIFAVCSVANVSWVVQSSMGNITFV